VTNSDQSRDTRVTIGEIRDMFEALSNWGRWSGNDHLGTLNYVTDQKRVEAAKLVESGVSVSCAWDIGFFNPVGNLVAPQRWMTDSGLGENDPESPAGPLSDDGHQRSSSEFISMVFHGLSMTHLDALSHMYWEGRMYGGLPASYVTEREGATVHDVLSAAGGIQTRGVLLDIAAVLGYESLPLDFNIFPDDLETAEAAAKVTVSSGDVLLMRTGDGKRRQEGGWDPDVNGQPGLHPSCLPWLHAREVAAIGLDGPQEVHPSPSPEVTWPFHSVAIAAMGLWLIDNCQLEDLAQMCRSRNRWTFMMTIAPMRLDGATGSPVNPIALF
jgi:kynurenine formamidase